jgi:hypothetical protein
MTELNLKQEWTLAMLGLALRGTFCLWMTSVYHLAMYMLQIKQTLVTYQDDIKRLAKTMNTSDFLLADSVTVLILFSK